jgi:predicted membrane-bound spermidine synthase
VEQSSRRNIFFFIFAVSGFSGLIYESIWTHYLKLFLGHAAYAQTLVLVIFMGGMAAGSWLCSRYSGNWKNLLLAYALAEGIIGISAIFFHSLFIQFIEISFLSVIPAIDSVPIVNLYKWGMAAILILPQSILLGMTFPLMSAGIIRRFPNKPGYSISILYFSNSLGGAIGVLTSGFLLIKWLGLPGTIICAGVINILLATTVWTMVRKQQTAPISKTTKTGIQPTNNIFYRTLLSVALLTGLASFIYEIGWIRMLSLVLGSSTHAFELMLSAFILGLALGGFWIRKRIDLIKNPVRFLAWLQIAMGLFALSTLLLYGNSFNIMQWLLDTLEKNDTGYALFNLSSHAIALTIMLPTTVCAGMTLPLLTFSLIKAGYGEKSIGIIYSANTVGAIAGILIAVHIAMPLLGLKGLIILGSGIDILAGLVLLWYMSAYSTIRLPSFATAVGVICILSSIFFVTLDSSKMASGIYRDVEFLDKYNIAVLDHKDGKTASVDLTGKKGGLVSIRTNGKTDAAINMEPGGHYFPDESTMILAAAIPLLLHPDARTIANIGLGSGLTTHVSLQAKSVKQVDTIEIEQAMVDVARGFRPRNELVYTDPRSSIHIEDAKTFFSSHNKKYDIIISEPSNPWVSGVSGLFSNEFYQLVKRHLSSQGLFVQWIQLYEIDLELVVSVLKALASNFNTFDIYASNSGDMLIISTLDDNMPKLDNRLFTDEHLAPELHKIDIYNLQDIFLRKIGDRELFLPLLNDYGIAMNSDYYPVLDQNAARARFLKKDAVDLLSLTLEPIPALELLGISRPDWQHTEVTATKHFKLSEAAYGATRIRDHLTGSGPVFTPAAESQEFANEAKELKRLLLDCVTPPHGDKIFVLFGGALKLVPYLRPEELQVIWQSLESGPCLKNWSTRELLWFEFIKAMSNRNTDRISSLSGLLLADSRDLTPARKKYLVAASMLANLALGNKQTAKQLWSENKGALFGQDETRLLFRLLALHSKNQTDLIN